MIQLVRCMPIHFNTQCARVHQVILKGKKWDPDAWLPTPLSFAVGVNTSFYLILLFLQSNPIFLAFGLPEWSTTKCQWSRLKHIYVCICLHACMHACQCCLRCTDHLVPTLQTFVDSTRVVRTVMLISLLLCNRICSCFLICENRASNEESVW